MIPLSNTLDTVRQLGIDTAPFIYFVERHPDYLAHMRMVFRGIRTGDVLASTSVVTLTEVLTKPLQMGNTYLVSQYRTLIAGNRTLTLVPATPDIADRAADLRARYALRTADALQLATALASGCDAFLTNDFKLRRVVELRVLLLADLAAT